MKQKHLVSLLMDSNILIPLEFYRKYKELNVTLEEFIFLMYLRSKGNFILFDPSTIALELGYSSVEVLEIISSLTDKKMLVIDTKKNDKGIVEEKLDLTLFYEKLVSVILDDKEFKEETKFDSSIFSSIEKEFGRTLNPSEIEFIKAWSSNFSSELIIEAVKEAVLNGVSSIRYIDKILYEWDKKGLKTADDVRHFLNKKRNEPIEPVEVFDYDWFDEDEEE